MSLLVQFSPGASPAEPLRTAREVLALSPEALAQKPPVRLRGVVTYFKSEGFPDLIIQDDTGGVFIGGVTSNSPTELRPGVSVEVEGTAGTRSFTPRVQAGRIRVVGTNALPAPERASFDDLRSGRLDCRYVEAAGVVRSATIDHELNPPRLILRIATPAGSFYAWVLRFGEDDGQRLVDASVRVRGVCLAWENPRRQPTSLRLLVNDLDAITITRPPPVDAFAAPLATPDSLLRYRPEGLNQHRVRLRGVVTWWRPGDFLVIQNATFGVRVNSDARTPLKLGDEVEAVGFPALMGYSAALQDSVYRVVGHAGEPTAVLQFEPRVAVVAEAEDGAQAVAKFREHRPDVTLMDVRMPVLDGLEALRRVRSEFPEARVLMLTTSETEADIQAALAAGAAGYLLKNASPSELVDAVLAVHRGERWLPESLAKRIDQDAKESPLSPRQLEVLELLAKGLSNKEIASVLNFTTDGVKHHLKSIYAKLGVQDRTEAVVNAIQRGLVRVE